MSCDERMQAAGWIVILLFGFLFALLAVFLVRWLPLILPLVSCHIGTFVACLPMHEQRTHGEALTVHAIACPGQACCY